jgi:hypothetical protein
MLWRAFAEWDDATKPRAGNRARPRPLSRASRLLLRESSFARSASHGTRQANSDKSTISLDATNAPDALDAVEPNDSCNAPETPRRLVPRIRSPGERMGIFSGIWGSWACSARVRWFGWREGGGRGRCSVSDGRRIRYRDRSRESWDRRLKCICRRFGFSSLEPRLRVALLMRSPLNRGTFGRTHRTYDCTSRTAE